MLKNWGKNFKTLKSKNLKKFFPKKRSSPASDCCENWLPSDLQHITSKSAAAHATTTAAAAHFRRHLSTSHALSRITLLANSF